MLCGDRYKVIDYGLADFEARYAAGMIGDAADQGTQQAPKEETFRQRKRREHQQEDDPNKSTRLTLSLKKNVIPKVTTSSCTACLYGGVSSDVSFM